MFTLLLINTERFIAVTRPFQYEALVTKSKAYVAVAFLVLFSLSSGLMSHLLPGRKSNFNPVLHACVSDPIDPEQSDLFGTLWNFIFFLLPVLITLVMFVRVYFIARRHARRIAAQSVNSDTKPSIKGSTTFFLMTVTLLTVTIPTVLGYSYENMTRKQIPLLYSYTCSLLIYSYSIVNVCIYYARNSAFSRKVKELWGHAIKSDNTSGNSSSVAVVS